MGVTVLTTWMDLDRRDHLDPSESDATCCSSSFFWEEDSLGPKTNLLMPMMVRLLGLLNDWS